MQTFSPGYLMMRLRKLKERFLPPDQDMSSRKMRKDVSNEKWKIKALPSGEGIT